MKKVAKRFFVFFLLVFLFLPPLLPIGVRIVTTVCNDIRLYRLHRAVKRLPCRILATDARLGIFYGGCRNHLDFQVHAVIDSDLPYLEFEQHIEALVNQISWPGDERPIAGAFLIQIREGEFYVYSHFKKKEYLVPYDGDIPEMEYYPGDGDMDALRRVHKRAGLPRTGYVVGFLDQQYTAMGRMDPRCL